jgi:hypothetical protein
MLKKLLKNELFHGIVIGIVLTVIGAFAMEYWHQKYDREKTDKETTVLLYKQLNGRFLLAQNVLTVSKSKVLLEDRWDFYLKEGYMPWQVNRFLFFQLFDKNKKNELSEKLKNADVKLADLHDSLIQLRIAVKYDKTIKEKKDARFIAEKKIKEVRVLIDEINRELTK